VSRPESPSHDPLALAFDRGTLTLQTPLSAPLARWSPAVPWTWDARTGHWRTHAMHYRQAIEGLRSCGVELLNLVPQWERIKWPAVDMPQPRTEQVEAVERWWDTRQGVVEMPTGTGKTEIALAIMQRSAVSTLVVSPVRDLMYQWHLRILDRLGYDAGVIGDNVYRVRPVSVTTYDSACIHMEHFGNKFALLVFDECHHLPGPMRGDAARMSPAPFRLGLTATLQRADGRHRDLEQLIGPTVYSLPLSQVRGKTLAEFDVVRIPVHLTSDEQSRYDLLARRVQAYMAQRIEDNRQFSWEKLCQETRRDPAARQALIDFRAKKAIEERAAEKLRVLEDIFRLHVGSPTLIFAGSNAMARDIARRFLIPCLLNHCRKQERLDILRGLADGSYPAVVANQVLDEGVDVPAVKVAVVVGGSASTRQSRQRLGRILRKHGNQRATLYEVVCRSTTEENRSRRRRSDDAFEGTRHRKL
jgi:superfamily II DNA or RNA helicase